MTRQQAIDDAVKHVLRQQGHLGLYYGGAVSPLGEVPGDKLVFASETFCKPVREEFNRIMNERMAA